MKSLLAPGPSVAQQQALLESVAVSACPSVNPASHSGSRAALVVLPPARRPTLLACQSCILPSSSHLCRPHLLLLPLLQGVLGELQRLCLEHFREEEEGPLPAMRQNFTPKEINKHVVSKIMSECHVTILYPAGGCDKTPNGRKEGSGQGHHRSLLSQLQLSCSAAAAGQPVCRLAFLHDPCSLHLTLLPPPNLAMPAGSMDGDGVGAFLHPMTKEERRGFARQEGIPFFIRWILFRQAANYERQVAQAARGRQCMGARLGRQGRRAGRQSVNWECAALLPTASVSPGPGCPAGRCGDPSSASACAPRQPSPEQAGTIPCIRLPDEPDHASQLLGSHWQRRCITHGAPAVLI
jgi:hypothetical protein